MKTIFLFISTILFAQNCSKQALNNNLQESFPIAIKEVYHQHWMAGVRGGGSGTGFYIEFEKVLPENIVLNQLYFRKGMTKANKVSETQYMFSFKGAANWKHENESESDEPTQITTTEPPFTITDNEAILQYTQKGIKKYYKITNVKEKQPLEYPSVRPRN